MQALLASWSTGVESLSQRSSTAEATYLSHLRAAVEALGSRPCLSSPTAGLEERAADLEQTAERLHEALPRVLSRRRDEVSRYASSLASCGPRLMRGPESELARLAATLDALSPLKVLGRGYAIARGPEGKVLKSVEGLASGDRVSVQVGKGSFDATVGDVRAS